MAISPQVLESIRNPTGGKLGQIGETYRRAKQTGIENTRAEEKMQMARDAATAADEQQTIENMYKNEANKRAEEAGARAEKAAVAAQEEAAKNQMITGSKVAYSYAKSSLDWRANNEDKTDEEFAKYQSDLWDSMDEYSKSLVPKGFQSEAELTIGKNQNEQRLRIFEPENWKEKDAPEKFSDFGKIPGTKLYGQKSSKTGKYTNIKDSVDGKTSLGSSEFERHLSYLKDNNLIDEETYNNRIQQRAKGFAGEMTGAGRERLDDKQRDRYNKETKALREEYTKGVSHFKGMSDSIEGAFAAIESGDTKLSEILLNQVMSQVQDTDVRAFQMYGEFDKEFGNLAQRISGKLSRFFTGTRTEDEKQEIISVLNKFNESYVKPANDKIRTRYRELAIQQDKDPFDVVPPKNVDDIKSSKLLSKKEKIKMIKDFFPDWKP